MINLCIRSEHNGEASHKDSYLGKILIAKTFRQKQKNDTDLIRERERLGEGCSRVMDVATIARTLLLLLLSQFVGGKAYYVQ